MILTQTWFIILLFNPTANVVFEDSGDPPHAIYISVVDFNRLSADKASVEIKVFTDDIEDALFNYGQERLNFTDVLECSTNKTTITDYFKAHLSLTINDVPVILTYESCELNGDSVWFKFTAETPKTWSEFKIEGDHLMELFPAQVNIFNVSDGDNTKMFKLTSSQKSHTINF